MQSETCPVCGGNLVMKEVEKLLRGGDHTAVLTVTAEVCEGCGERLYSRATIERFAEVRTKLRQQDTDEFQAVGTSFFVP